MKKKNILTIIVSLALVLVLGVGATLAYISATDNNVVNTFTFGSMTVDLSEPAAKDVTPIANETITDTDNGLAYANVVPGQLLNKAPSVSVTTSAPAYVFVQVSGFTATLQCDGITAGWTAIEGSTDGLGNGTYWKLVASGSADAQSLGTVFTQVKVGDAAVADGAAVSLPTVTIAVSAIQSTGFASADAALAQAPAFKN